MIKYHFLGGVTEVKSNNMMFYPLPKTFSFIAAVWLALSGVGCSGGGGGSPAPTVLPIMTDVTTENNELTSEDKLVFTKVSDSGLDRAHSTAEERSDEAPFISGGLAAADIDKNGFVDLVVVGGASEPNHFYFNEGGVFEENGAELGVAFVNWGSGPAFGDIDGDGDLDLFIGAVEGDPVYLLENKGSHFIDITSASGLTLTADNTMSGTFYDYDRDGLLDLFLTHWEVGRYPGQDTETVWRNNGDMTFSSASIETGIAQGLIEGPVDWSFTANLSDIDGDGDGDLLMASDYGQSQIFRNNDDGTFTKITDREVIVDQNGMGAAVGDFDNDGDMDWFVTSIHNLEMTGPNDDIERELFGNRLYRNDGNGLFSGYSILSGISNGGWAWGACAADFDNDTLLDIFHVNGWVEGPLGEFATDQVRFYHALGNMDFEERASEVGLDDNGQGRGVACFDIERDGDIDIVISNNAREDAGGRAIDIFTPEVGGENIVLFRNDSINQNNYLSIRLLGAGTNTYGIGAHIAVVVPSGNRQVREMGGSNNFVSHNPFEVHFGLGEQEQAEVTVTWPDESISVEIVESNQQVVISHPNR